MTAAPKAIAMPVACTAKGTKYFAPAMAEAEVCARFLRAFAAAARQPVVASAAPAAALSIELQFKAKGFASAKATRLRGGPTLALPLQELAVSDRQFNATDIDHLAAAVERGMRT